MAGISATSACTLLATDPERSTRSPNGGRDERQAPQLADQVKAGRLPQLDQRLPDEPLVIEPTERIGSYGGEWRTFIMNVSGSDVYENIGYDNLVRWSPDWTDVIPNVALSWDIENDGRDYTFQLRNGMRWSDGEPFTADDVMFAYQDVLHDEELFPVFPSWLSVNGEPATFERVGDHEFRFSFAEPNGFFLQQLATGSANILTSLPRHYLKKFHRKYNPDVAKLAEEEGYAGWAEMLLAKGGAGLLEIGAWQSKDFPTLLAWKVVEPLSGGRRLLAERNPYYWKVDSDGRQLPYLDRVVLTVMKDPEVAVLQTSQGQFSLPPAEVMTPQNKPVLARGRNGSGYHFIELLTSKTNNGIFVFNMSHEDPAVREVFQNKDFRIGLSYAINREEIIAAVFQGQGEPWQSSPRQESEFYDRELAKQYTEFDPAKANAHLDQAGYARRDAGGFRLRPDGVRVAFTAEVPIGFNATWTDTAELVKAYWREVGVDMTISTIASTLFFERVAANKHEVVVWNGENGLRDAVLDPKWYFPSGGGSYFSVPWGTWYDTGGASGSVPPNPARRQMELYDEIKATPDAARQGELFMQILRIAQEQFYVIGTALPVGSYSVVRDDFHNVPGSYPEAFLYPDPGPTRPEQFFTSNPQ